MTEEECVDILCGGTVGVIAGGIMTAFCCTHFCPCFINWWCLSLCGALGATVGYTVCCALCRHIPTIEEFGCAVACGAVCSGFEDPITGYLCGLGCEQICNVRLSLTSDKV